ncbi:hypothetical protein NDU88_001843 [Pleurodeles waltl]|uniref:Uncharacterized protein n=1 Tax=Pleurodeles waltl TaxID=8319 RepID=A0AAV7QB10_PLEWA|nr:hypothetical protein NDU88_001843 [Pleurodeles waltl]
MRTGRTPEAHLSLSTLNQSREDERGSRAGFKTRAEQTKGEGVVSRRRRRGRAGVSDERTETEARKKTTLRRDAEQTGREAGGRRPGGEMERTDRPHSVKSVAQSGTVLNQSGKQGKRELGSKSDNRRREVGNCGILT